MAQLFEPPTLSLVASVIPLTITGVKALVLPDEPLPSCPNGLDPQHAIDPVASSAQLDRPPAPTETAFVIPVTETGVVEKATDDPLPSCPTALRPQHFTVPSASKAHELVPPL